MRGRHRENSEQRLSMRTSLLDSRLQVQFERQRQEARLRVSLGDANLTWTATRTHTSSTHFKASKQKLVILRPISL